MRLDLDADNVKEEEVTVAEIRSESDDWQEKLYGWLDVVQGEVYQQKHKEFYLVIKVTP